jgi:hypothetical protein
MSTYAQAVMLTFPPRELSPLERELVGEWLALAGDVSDCHVSSRRSDDPALYRRIVVSDAPDGRPTHLIHHPSGLDLWVKMTVGPYMQFEMFPTLTGALNSIRRVLVDGEPRDQQPIFRKQKEAPRVDEQKATLAELERRRTDCIALAEKEADPSMKAALLKRAADLGTDIRHGKRQKSYAPRGPGGGRLKKYRNQDGMLRKQ